MKRIRKIKRFIFVKRKNKPKCLSCSKEMNHSDGKIYVSSCNHKAWINYDEWVAMKKWEEKLNRRFNPCLI